MANAACIWLVDSYRCVDDDYIVRNRLSAADIVMWSIVTIVLLCAMIACCCACARAAEKWKQKPTTTDQVIQSNNIEGVVPTQQQQHPIVGGGPPPPPISNTNTVNGIPNGSPPPAPYVVPYGPYDPAARPPIIPGGYGPNAPPYIYHHHHHQGPQYQGIVPHQGIMQQQGMIPQQQQYYQTTFPPAFHPRSPETSNLVNDQPEIEEVELGEDEKNLSPQQSSQLSSRTPAALKQVLEEEQRKVAGLEQRVEWLNKALRQKEDVE